MKNKKLAVLLTILVSVSILSLGGCSLRFFTRRKEKIETINGRKRTEQDIKCDKDVITEINLQEIKDKLN